MSQAKEYFHLIEKLENDPKFCFMVINSGNNFIKCAYEFKRWENSDLGKVFRVGGKPLLEHCKINYENLYAQTESCRKNFKIEDENHETYKQCLQTISTNSLWSLIHSCFSSQSFKLGEDAIAQNDLHSYLYAHLVIGNRFELGENSISKNAELSIEYARKVLLEMRFEMAEPLISKDPQLAAKYAQIIGKFEMGEPAIATNYELSYWYAENILRGRFELGEDAMMQDEKTMLLYATNVMKGKLPEKMHNAMVLLTYGNKEAA